VEVVSFRASGAGAFGDIWTEWAVHNVLIAPIGAAAVAGDLLWRVTGTTQDQAGGLGTGRPIATYHVRTFGLGLPNDEGAAPVCIGRRS
jgi:hypothetical protein